jgi:transposase
MRRYSEAVEADVRRRMSPPHRQGVAQISAELGIHVVTLYNWRKDWRLQGEVVPASEKDPDGWSAADKFTVVLETAGLNATELGALCRERGLYPEQVERWRQAAQDANEKPVLTLKEQKPSSLSIAFSSSATAKSFFRRAFSLSSVSAV